MKTAPGDATHTVVIRLDPAAMDEPDLEIRRELEKMLRESHPDISFFDDGYGFARSSEAMLLTYATSEPDRLVEALVDLLTNHSIAGNELATSAMVAVAPRNPHVEAGKEFAGHKIVYPPHEAGNPLPD
jgi:hypothetical protein